MSFPSLSVPFLLLPCLVGRGCQTPPPVHCREGWGNSTNLSSFNQNKQGMEWSQFEALLLEELDVEAMAMLELPVAATDLRM